MLACRLPGASRCAAAVLALGCTLGACGGQPEQGRAPSVEGPRLAFVRPDTPGNDLQFSFDTADLVETFGVADGRFLVHYTRAGDNAVPDADEDSSGVPDFVEQVASVYEQVLDFYEQTLGFRVPLSDGFIADNGGDDRFDVYLVDFGGIGDGNYQNDQCTTENAQICAGYMIQENDFAGYGYSSTLTANRILASHELFHAVQAAYDIGQGSILAEGSAVWATEQFDPALRDFEYFIEGYFDNPDRSLDVPMPGPVDPFSYGTAIFFQFLEERYGAGTVRALWERCENGANGVADPAWFAELDSVLGDVAGASFAEAFIEFVTYNLFTAGYADPERSYAEGIHYPYVAMEPVSAPYTEELMRVFYASAQYHSVDAAGRSELTARLVVPAGDEDELEGLVLLMAVDDGEELTTIVSASDPATPLTVSDVPGTARFVVVVANTLREGESQRPGLCLGNAAEVELCAAAITGAGGAGGGGGAGGEPVVVPAAVDADEAGCGCRVALGRARAGSAGAAARPRGPANSTGFPPWLAAGLVGLAWGARRRRAKPPRDRAIR